ncbi:MAG: hypothetical protein ACKVWV_00920 [Planctomycetota bacterium]
MSAHAPAPAGGQLERLVTRARGLDFSLRFVEAVCLGACAAFVCAAAARAEGAALAGPVWLVAIATGTCAAATWTIERARGAAAFVHALDRRLVLDGALVTAWDRRFRASAVAALLSRRVVLELASRGRRAVVSSFSPGWVAAPLLGGAVLALASESSQGGAWRAQIAADAVVLETDGAVDAADDPELRARIEALATDVRTWLERDPGEGGRTTGAELSALEGFERRARALAEQLPAQRRSDLDRVADGIARVRGSGGGGGGGSSSSDTGPRAETSAGAESLAPGGVGESTLTSTLALGTMVRPSNGGESSARGEAAEGGVSVVRWWPPAYDGLVARWLEPNPSASR